MMTYFRKLFHRFKNHSPTHIFSIFTALSASPHIAECPLPAPSFEKKYAAPPGQFKDSPSESIIDHKCLYLFNI